MGKPYMISVGSAGYASLTKAFDELKGTLTVKEEPRKIDLPAPVTKYKPDFKPSGRASRRERRKNKRKKRK